MAKKEKKEKGFFSKIVLLIKELVLKSLQEKLEQKNEFSKRLLIQESVLIWIITLSFIIMAFICIVNEFLGELPWLAVLCSCAWAAYGVSQACYYNKSKAENTKGGVKYDSIMAKLDAEDGEVPEEEAGKI